MAHPVRRGSQPESPHSPSATAQRIGRRSHQCDAAVATSNHGCLAKQYRKYGPGVKLAKLERSGLTEQPESLVICERLDAAPMRLQGVWDGELEELMLERFTQLW